MHLKRAFFFFLASASASASRAAGPAAMAFGARPAVQQLSLSPDGKRVAVVTPAGDRGTRAVVVELTGDQKKTVILSAGGDPDEIRYCKWVTDARLVCNVYSVQSTGPDLAGSNKLISMLADGSDAKLLTAPVSSNALFNVLNGGSIVDLQPGNDDPESILVTRYIVPEQQTGSIIAQAKQGLGIERVNLRSMARQPVVQPNESAFEYISDGLGTVRVMGSAHLTDDGYKRDTNRYFYRLQNETRWQPLSTEILLSTGQATGFVPIAVDPKLNLAYGLEGRDGRAVLTSIALDGSLKKELVFDQGQVDVDDVLTIGRQKRVIGVTFATETRQAAIFDPAIKKLTDALGKALPGQQVQIVDASADENVLLIWAGSDTDPGRYYIYDKGTRQLGELLAVRPQLASKALAKVKPITFPAADGTQIPAYLTLPSGSDGKGLPLIVMPHGGPSSRDEWGFNWLPQYFAARGFAVLQPNYRGSTGYGAAWFEKNGFQSWRKAIGDVNDAAHWAIAQGLANKDKVAIVGWSYGGYAALQSGVVEPGLFKAIVAVAPVTDLDDWRRELSGFSTYYRRDQFVGRGAHVEEGSPARQAAAIKAPVLLFHGDKDVNVRIGESRLMRDRLRDAGKSGELVEFAGLDHYLDDDKARADLLDKADAFLRKNLSLP
jgi:dipeptidyl aminopeptidase/acylaminoacyl peptidase